MADPPASGARKGEILCGKYRLDELLGEGGMGEVYRATNVLIGRPVAIKVLRPEHAQNEHIVGRFLREARAANLVRHPNVVDVLDIGQDEARSPFIVQELLQGEDLASRLRREGGKLALDVALEILLPVVDAVAAGHASGVVHRDLKPENVFLARVSGKILPKLLDFGISKIQAGPDDRKMTLAGTAMGTPTYMSPEQIKGYDVDVRTDVWAFGVMTYELVSGALPFDAESDAALFVKVCTEEPTPLGNVAPDLPRALVEIVGKCLQRNKEERYPDASALGDALRAALLSPASGAADGAERKSLPEVPSLAPPAPKPANAAPPKPAPPKPAPPAPPPAASAPRSAPLPAPVAAPARGGGEIALQSFRPPSFGRVAAAPRRELRRDDAGIEVGVLLPVGLYVGGLVAGLLTALIAYEVGDVAPVVTTLAPNVRTIAGIVLLVVGGAIAIGAYRRVRADGPGGRQAGFGGAAVGAALFFAGAKLLMA